MSIKIELTENTASTLRGVIAKRCTLLKDEIERLQAELNDNEDLLKQLSGNSAAVRHTIIHGGMFYGGGDAMPIDKPTIAEYSKDWTWSTKIIYVMREAGAPIGTADIVKRIMEIEPYLTDRSKIVGSVSATLSVKSREGKYFRLVSVNDRGENVFELLKEGKANATSINTSGV